MNYFTYKIVRFHTVKQRTSNINYLWKLYLLQCTLYICKLLRMLRKG